MIALYILVGLAILILIISLAIPTEFKLERDVVINKPKAEVFSYVKSLKNQDNWSVWNMKDPNMKREFTGTDGTQGFISRWEGNKDVGIGEQEIKKIVEGERVDMQLRFEKPFKMTNDAFITTIAESHDQTRVRWGFSGTSPRPMNIFSVMMKGALTKDFDQGLSNLKRILEK
ncbi:MAG TPA: SRPBCC family protein [Bacteroidia bacterium]|jgi:hypothetical protein